MLLYTQQPYIKKCKIAFDRTRLGDYYYLCFSPTFCD